MTIVRATQRMIHWISLKTVVIREVYAKTLA